MDDAEILEKAADILKQLIKQIITETHGRVLSREDACELAASGQYIPVVEQLTALAQIMREKKSNG